MRTPTRPLAALLGVACLVLGLGACSSSAPAKPASQATLTSILLKQSDLPAGYTAKPDSGDTNDTTDQKLATCTGVSGVKESDQLRTVQSDDFTKGQIQYSSDAQTYKTQAAVDARVKVLKSSKINQCLNSLFKQLLGQGLGAGETVTSSSITIKQGPYDGQSNVVGTAAGQVDVSASGQTVSVNLFTAFITGPLITSSVEIVALNSAIDASTRDAAVTAVAKRTDKA